MFDLATALSANCAEMCGISRHSWSWGERKRRLLLGGAKRPPSTDRWPVRLLVGSTSLSIKGDDRVGRVCRQVRHNFHPGVALLAINAQYRREPHCRAQCVLEKCQVRSGVAIILLLPPGAGSSIKRTYEYTPLIRQLGVSKYLDSFAAGNAGCVGQPS